MKMSDRVNTYYDQNHSRESGALTSKQLRRIKRKDVCPSEHCDARGLDPCKTKDGRHAKQPHAGRYPTETDAE
ncbi:MAG TPA: hypothetical protein VFO86_15195 [Terriglobia bacterium]|nr:hypothetical protein [Terriglobia bacterium]